MVANVLEAISSLISRGYGVCSLESTARRSYLKDILTDIAMLMRTKIFLWCRKKAISILKAIHSNNISLYIVRINYGFFVYTLVILSDERGHYIAFILEHIKEYRKRILSAILDKLNVMRNEIL